MRLAMWKDARDRAFLQSEVNRAVAAGGFSLDRKKAELRKKIDQRRASDNEVSIETRYTEHLYMHHGKRALLVTSRVHPSEA